METILAIAGIGAVAPASFLVAFLLARVLLKLLFRSCLGGTR
jgi:hypothetical protein